MRGLTTLQRVRPRLLTMTFQRYIQSRSTPNFPVAVGSRYLIYRTGLHRRMRMYWEIHTLPNRRPEPNGIRK